MTGLRQMIGVICAVGAFGMGFHPVAMADVVTFSNVTVIDGTGAAPMSDMTVVVRDGRFEAVIPSALAPDVEGREIDGRGKYLIPGLMDLHIHLRGGTRITPDGLREEDIRRDYGIQALHSYLYSGVTSVYDAGNLPEYIFGLREEERAGTLVAPRIFATGGIVTAPGSHGSGPGSTDVESWPEAREALDLHIAREPDVLKLTYEERGWGSRPMIPRLDPELMQRIVEYYNAHGIRTTVHASGELRHREAVFAGVDTLAHPVIQGPVSDGYVQLMAAKRIPMVTTLTIGESYSRLVDDPGHLDQPLYRATYSAEEIDELRTGQREEWARSPWTQWMKIMTPIAQENVRRVHDAGGILVLGSDQTIGPAAHREMELLADAGIAPLDIIRIATLNGAIFLGLESELGSITEGKLADAVLLSADPTEDIDNAKRIELVMKEGDIIDTDALQLAGTPESRPH